MCLGYNNQSLIVSSWVKGNYSELNWPGYISTSRYYIPGGGGGEHSLYIVVYLYLYLKGMACFIPFKGKLFIVSLLRVDINFVPFKGIFYTNNCRPV